MTDSERLSATDPTTGDVEEDQTSDESEQTSKTSDSSFWFDKWSMAYWIEDERISYRVHTRDKINRKISEDKRHRFIVCEVKIWRKFYSKCSIFLILADFFEYLTSIIKIIGNLRLPYDIRTREIDFEGFCCTS